MDSDDYSYPNRLEKQLAYLEKHPNITLLGCNATYMETGTDFYKGHRYIFPLSNNQIRACLPFFTPFIHPSVIMNKDDVLSVGGYPDYKYAEDYGLWVKLSLESNFYLENLPDVYLKYRKGEDKPQYRRIQQESVERLYNDIGTKFNCTNYARYLWWVELNKNNITLSQATETLDSLNKIEKALLNNFINIDKKLLKKIILTEKKRIYHVIKKYNFSLYVSYQFNKIQFKFANLFL